MPRKEGRKEGRINKEGRTEGRISRKEEWMSRKEGGKDQ